MIISLLGAESTGKSTLAAALHRHLHAALAQVPPSPDTPRVQHTGEYLRDWCEQHRRTPQAHEQEHIAQVQATRISSTSPTFTSTHWVVADTTPLMTAVYSEHYFGDTSLYPLARPFHDPKVSPSTGGEWPPVTLLLGLDLPWQADGSWRDGPATQVAVDNLLRHKLAHWQVPYQTIYGSGHKRVVAALLAVAAHVEQVAGEASCLTAQWVNAIKKEALKLSDESDEAEKSLKPYVICACCDDPASERKLFSRLMTQRTAAAQTAATA